VTVVCEESPAAVRRSPRQQQLVEVAARLFAARGFHSVGVNDIAGELGMTGASLYRHYPTKTALLVDVLDEIIESHVADVCSLEAQGLPPLETLHEVVRRHMGFVLEQSHNITTWRTDYRNIPESDRHRLRQQQRAYVEAWAAALRRVRPELDTETARTICQAVIALVQSPIDTQLTLGRDVLAATLTSTAIDLLLTTGEDRA
jgi:AcrR family transcriptional regulator